MRRLRPLRFQEIKRRLERAGFGEVSQRGSRLRVEVRLDGTLAARWEGRYLEIALCPVRPPSPPPQPYPRKTLATAGQRKVNRAWMEGFWERPSPPTWLAIQQSNRSS